MVWKPKARGFVPSQSEISQKTRARFVRLACPLPSGRAFVVVLLQNLQLKTDKAQEIKKLNQQIQMVQSDMSKHREALEDCLR